MSSQSPNLLSEQLLLSVKLKEDSTSLQKELENLSLDKLKELMPNDNQKVAFWINIYNAYYQILHKEQGSRKPDIYKKRLITLAGLLFSLDDLEHGILRRCKYKYSLGYIFNPFARKEIKELSVAKLDYRIHFALNCGAKSCPPIAFYNDSKLSSQLDLATKSFLEAESDFDKQNKILHVTALFKWFYADFGGKKGIRQIYKKQLNKDISDYTIKYKDYSWEEDLDNFVSES